ncbi:uncharacterized protein FOMMEDRAFT_19703 [Fomitiporia mediterranea MF3/22]|uniref:uncharacterized protein n=1 Tax=Fomitiporia mediterranea (strain MF3/22) TaxID=694068 RepID=UPI0004407E17|nr:uncharacterized protein FOMMEDRAFT_19703 [Fomitiporia mediterranea MF3/22]EJD04484.1 hypothetical protein FOMMEDRAFT_19703 [Fomitiporia mediterranea MF3/22]
MSLRHPVRERDVRLHDPHAPPPPPPGPSVQGPPSAGGPPPPHAAHMNGTVAGAPPLSNGHAPHPHAIGAIGLSPVAAPAGPPGVPHANGAPPVPSAAAVHPTLQKLSKANEETWLLIGSVAEQMGDLDRALSAYERALQHNPNSLPGLTQVAGIARIRENYSKAIEYFQRVLQFQQENGEVWSALGHCYLMQDDLQKAYSAYQQALYLLPNPKEDPKLWYGIGILYDRYGSLDHAEEAFASVLHMDKDFDKANEILFRLGIIYKQQGKYTDSLDCFDRILRNPPSPLAHADIWFQIGHVYEQQKDYMRAKDAYERVVQENPAHAKVLQQLGWLYHQEGSAFQSQDLAITYLTKSLEADPSDAQSWYLLGRAYMAGQKYNKAYEAYQQAVYRDGRNPTFWCSIGVLYFQINQYRDALDAYSRAIRINPYISEVWFDLGSLYESCNNQISDAIDAYARASELDPGNVIISQRLQLLRTAQQTGQTVQTSAPLPQDVHPTAYASAVGPPVTMSGGPPLLMSSGPTPRPIFTRTESREHGNENGMSLPSPHATHAPPPFRGGPPPPVVLDDSRRPASHTPLAPMEVDRATPRDGFPPRESSRSRGPGGTPQSLLLHHPQNGPQVAPEHQRDPAYYSRPSRRAVSRSVSPPPQRQIRGPPEPREVGYHGYPPAPPPQTNGGSAPGRPGQLSQHSPRSYQGHYDPTVATPPPPPPSDAWERDRRMERERSRTGRDSERAGVPPNVQGYSQSRGPTSPMSAHSYDHGHPPSRRTTLESPSMHRPGSPMSRQVSVSERSPVVGPGAQGPGIPRWQSSNRYADDPGRSPHPHATSPSMTHAHSQIPPSGTPSRRYDPRFDESAHGSRMERLDRHERDRDRLEREREFERERMESRGHAHSPDSVRSASAMSVGGGRNVLPPPPMSAGSAGSGDYPVPYPATAGSDSVDRRRGRKKDADAMSINGPPTPAPGSAGSSAASNDKRKQRSGGRRTRKDGSESNAGSRAPSVQPSSFRVAPSSAGPIKSPPSPEPRSSASASGSSGRSSRPSPIGNALPSGGLPRREVDEDYDEGVAESLMSLAASGGSAAGPVSPTVSVGGRIRHVSPPPNSKNSVGSAGHSPQLPGPVMGSQNGNGGSLKRPLSPINTSDNGDSKRTRVEILNRPTIGRMNSPPLSNSRPSPIPFRTQAPRSPEDRVQPGDRDARRHDRSPSSSTNTTGIPSTMPLPPPPSAIVSSSNGPPPISTNNPVTLPPIATLTPVPNSPSSAGAPSPSLEQDRMQVDVGHGGRKRPNSHSRSGSGSTSPPAAPPLSRNKISDVMNPTGPGGPDSAHVRRNSSAHSSPTNTQSQGNAMVMRMSPEAKSTSPRS